MYANTRKIRYCSGFASLVASPSVLRWRREEYLTNSSSISISPSLPLSLCDEHFHRLILPKPSSFTDNTYWLLSTPIPNVRPWEMKYAASVVVSFSFHRPLGSVHQV